MARPRKLSIEEEAALQVARLAGTSVKTLMTRFGVGRRTVYDVLGRVSAQNSLINAHQDASQPIPFASILALTSR